MLKKREVSLLINEQWEQIKFWKKIQKFQKGDMSLRERILLHLYEMLTQHRKKM